MNICRPTEMFVPHIYCIVHGLLQDIDTVSFHQCHELSSVLLIFSLHLGSRNIGSIFPNLEQTDMDIIRDLLKVKRVGSRRCGITRFYRTSAY